MPRWMPEQLGSAVSVVVLVVDGLGWEQWQPRMHLTPVMAAMQASRLTTVAPSTTATALTSIATGLTPGEHGLVGYRMEVGGEVINVLRWHGERGDVRRSHQPRDVQPFAPFLGEAPPVISRAELESSAFTEAHLRGSRPVGWRAASSIAVEVGRQVSAGERFVYAYYDGIDKIAHERGFGDFYDAELATVDALVGAILAAMPAEAALVIIADHGQVMVGKNVVYPSAALLSLVRTQSGEGRFRWLHARAGAQRELLEAAEQDHAGRAWVLSREQIIDDGWFGPAVSAPVAARLGDVALVARDDVTFFDPADSGPFELQCRHGSLTGAEMYVPLIVGRGAK